jgi:hypothetical protein
MVGPRFADEERYASECVMVEGIMLLGIGFMAGCLLMVALIPLIHERAVRLTARRYQALTPLSVAEMQAEKDLLRAEFAMSIRRLEMTVEETKAKATQQLCEVGRKTAEVHRLNAELGKTGPIIRDLQVRTLKQKSFARRMVKLLVYLILRSRRGSGRALSIPALRPSGAEQWAAAPARFHMALQKSRMAHGGA